MTIARFALGFFLEFFLFFPLFGQFFLTLFVAVIRCCQGILSSKGVDFTRWMWVFNQDLQ